MKVSAPLLARPTLLPAVFTASLLLLAACSAIGEPQVANARSANGLAYDLVGRGPVVVLIHGTNLDRRMWDADVAWLRQQARVLRYDLRGQGASVFPAETYSNRDDLLALMAELGTSDVTLVGLSAGAQVALEVALESPDRVRRLVLVSPSLAGYVPREMPPFFADLGAALRARDFERANRVLLDSPIMAVPPASADLVGAMVEENTRLWTIPYSLVAPITPLAIERLEQIDTPVLVLTGQDDLEAIREQGRLLERRLPDARHVTIPGGGHLLNLTSPAAFRDTVSAFIAIKAQDHGRAMAIMRALAERGSRFARYNLQNDIAYTQLAAAQGHEGAISTLKHAGAQ